MLLPAARHVHSVPGLRGFSLLSIGQLCDSGYMINFDKSTMQVSFHGACVLQGKRPICSPPLPVHTTAAAIGTPKMAELVAFAHATLFSPALSTLEIALQKVYLTNFPGLTVNTLRRNPPWSPATVKGHLDQIQQNRQSTQPRASSINPEAVKEGCSCWCQAKRSQRLCSWWCRKATREQSGTRRRGRNVME